MTPRDNHILSTTSKESGNNNNNDHVNREFDLSLVLAEQYASRFTMTPQYVLFDDVSPRKNQFFKCFAKEQNNASIEDI